MSFNEELERQLNTELYWPLLQAVRQQLVFKNFHNNTLQLFDQLHTELANEINEKIVELSYGDTESNS